MIPNQLVDRQKKVPPLFELFGTKGNGKTDYANLLLTAFFQKPPDNPPLRLRKFEKALQDSLFFNRCYRELEAESGEVFLLEPLVILFYSNFTTDNFKTDL
jgi:hypothetical protein